MLEKEWVIRFISSHESYLKTCIIMKMLIFQTLQILSAGCREFEWLTWNNKDTVHLKRKMFHNRGGDGIIMTVHLPKFQKPSMILYYYNNFRNKNRFSRLLLTSQELYITLPNWWQYILDATCSLDNKYLHPSFF